MLIREPYAHAFCFVFFFWQGTIGRFAKIGDPVEAQKYVDLLVSYGHGALDAARAYGGGTTEEVSDYGCVYNAQDRRSSKRSFFFLLWLGHFQAGSQGRLCRYKVRSWSSLSRISRIKFS